MLLRCGAIVIMILPAYWVARLAWADHLSRGGQLVGRERAVQLAPAIATLRERLADIREESGGDSLPDLERAVSLDPENPFRRMRLGVQAELAGNFALAEQALLAAAARSRHYQPRYLLAQYYFRRQNADSFWRWARAAFETAYGDVMPLLDLCWRLQPDAQWIWQRAIPPRPLISRQYLAFVTAKQQWEVARSVALTLARDATADDRSILLHYCEVRLVAGDGAAAIAVWNALSRRGLVPYAPIDPVSGPYLTNAAFEHAPSAVGFDWRLTDTPGVTCTFYKQEIRLSFSGAQQERSTIAWQYVPVTRAGRYQLKFGVHSIDTNGVDGVGWSVSELSGTELGYAEARTGGLLLLSLRNDLVKVSLEYRRPLGSSRLQGTVAVTGLGMDLVQ